MLRVKKLSFAVLVALLIVGITSTGWALVRSDCDWGVLFVGDKYDKIDCIQEWEGDCPTDELNCQDSSWTLDGAIWNCRDLGFCNVGTYEYTVMDAVRAGAIHSKNVGNKEIPMFPHTLAWSESNKVLFTSWMAWWGGQCSKEEGDGSCSGMMLDARGTVLCTDGCDGGCGGGQLPGPPFIGTPVVSWYKWDPADPGAGKIGWFEALPTVTGTQYAVGGMAYDDAKDELYVTNVYPKVEGGAYVRLLDMTPVLEFNSKPVQSMGRAQFSLCVELCAPGCTGDGGGCKTVDMADVMCGDFHGCAPDGNIILDKPADIAFLDDELYVTYMGKFDYDDNGQCTQSTDSSGGQEQLYSRFMPFVAIFSTADANFGDLLKVIPVQMDCCADGCDYGNFMPATSISVIWDKDVERTFAVISSHGKEGHVAMIDVTETRKTGTYHGETKKVDDISTYLSLHCYETFDIRGIDASPCNCEDCGEGVIYLTAQIYDECPEDEEPSCDCGGGCGGQLEPVGAALLALKYNYADCKIDIVPLSVSKKILGGEEDADGNPPCPWDWEPGDLVATKWVYETDTVVEKVGGDPCFDDMAVFDITMHGGDDPLPLTVKFEDDYLDFQYAELLGTTEGDIVLEDPAASGGVASWVDVLDGTQYGHDPAVVRCYFDTLAETPDDFQNFIYAGSGEICGWEAFEICEDVPPVVDKACDLTATPCVEGTPCSAVLTEVSNPASEGAEGVCYFQIGITGNVCEIVVDMYFNNVEDPTLWEFVDGAWVLATGVVPGGDGPFDFDGLEWSEMMTLTLTGTVDTPIDTSGQVWGVFPASVSDPNLDPDDDNGGGGGSGISRTSGSSGCNVGFSMAALLFAVPLVSIFRKR